MDPIFHFDELDKISKTFEGSEIENLLIHITDPVQNNDFHDKYFQNLPIDLSKVVIIFSLNDSSLISPILKDRIHIIKVDNPTINNKVILDNKYILPKLYKTITGIKKEDILMTDDNIKYIITHYTQEEIGVRKLKNCLNSILMKLNT